MIDVRSLIPDDVGNGRHIPGFIARRQDRHFTEIVDIVKDLAANVHDNLIEFLEGSVLIVLCEERTNQSKHVSEDIVASKSVL